MAYTEEDFAALKKAVWGKTLTAADPEFLETLKTWALPNEQKIPLLFVKPRGTADVQLAVKFAKAHNLPFAVRSGGHSPSQGCLAHQGLTLDMSLMRSAMVDPVAKTVTVDGGCQLGDIDRETAVHGLAVPLGHAPCTGVGLIIGGGFGIATRQFGSACSHIISATIVKADGSVVMVDQEREPELLWALRGAGAVLGVVTKLTLRLHDVSDAVTGMLMIPDDKEHVAWRAAAKFMRDVGSKEPGFSTPVMRGLLPDGTPAIIMIIVYLGEKSHEERHAFLQPLRDLGPIVDTVGKFKYVDSQFSLWDMLSHLPPHYEYWTSGLVTSEKVYASDQFLDDFVTHVIDGTDMTKFPLSYCLIDCNMTKEPEDGPRAWANSQIEFLYLEVICYLDPAFHNDAKELAGSIKAGMAAYGDCEYANACKDAADSDAKLAARVGGPENLARLRAIKREIDPDNFFNSTPFAPNL